MQGLSQQVMSLPGDWSSLGHGHWVRDDDDISRGKGEFAKVYCVWNQTSMTRDQSTIAVKVAVQPARPHKAVWPAWSTHCRGRTRDLHCWYIASFI